MRKRLSIRSKIFYSLFGLFLVIVFTVLVSFIFPGRSKLIDDFRVELQRISVQKMDQIDTFAEQIGFATPYAKNTITYPELIPYLDNLKPGTIIFTSHGKNVCSLIPGLWKHSVIYLGTKKQSEEYFGNKHPIFNKLHAVYSDKNEHLILDASFKRGVAIRCISDLANLESRSTLKSILCFEPKLNKEENLNYLNYCFSQLGKGYDLNFLMPDSTDIYCTEIIYNGLLPHNINLEAYTNIMERDIILPRDMVNIIFSDETLKSKFEFKVCLIKEADILKSLTKDAGFLFNQTTH